MQNSDRQFEQDSLILVSGATGYVGHRLIRALKKKGYRLRYLVRNPEAIKDDIRDCDEIVTCDVLKTDSLQPAFEGVHTAYYLIHSMDEGKTHGELDRQTAFRFSEQARLAGVKRVIYLGGLGEGEKLSPHLKSRQEVGSILRESGIPIIEFRASIIIGAGSASFEMIRAVAERFPVIFAPLWSKTECQPIYIGNVISYLVAALERPDGESKIYEIGSPDVTCYLCLMQYYVKVRKLPHFFLQVPFLTPKIAGLGLIVTNPSLAKVGRALLEGLRTPTLINDDSATKDFNIVPLPSDRAIETALNEEDREFAETSWFDGLDGIKRKPYGGVKLGHRYVDTYFTHVDCPPEYTFAPVESIGGDTGWYCGHTLMRIRGFIDALAGGPGLRRCRPDSDQLVSGDIIDYWHVLKVIPNRHLYLEADMRVPGRGWLDFEIRPEGDGSRLRITAIFDPEGVFGLIYWFAIYPFHGHIFRSMLKQIKERAEAKCRKARQSAACDDSPLK